jgi:hypothetical protein
MNERSWLTSTKPYTLLGYLSRADRRKRRLFSCACCRRVAAFMPDMRSIHCVDEVERLADGLVSLSEVQLAAREADAAYRTADSNRVRRAAWAAVSTASRLSDTYVVVVVGSVLSAAHNRQEQKVLADLLRDIFGNPFRPITFDPAWRSDTAVSLAKHIYESRDFSAMPILADALQDAGCENADILTHCRDEQGTHVRGCWVVDLVLGKE